MDNALAVDEQLGTLFIDLYIRGFFPAEPKLVPRDSYSVRISHPLGQRVSASNTVNEIADKSTMNDVEPSLILVA